jgi:DNA-binding IclR family transcriptional regulator
MKKDIKKKILALLAEKTYGLSIEEIADILKVNRATASKYLLVMETEKSIAVRAMGKSKLHYLKKYFGGKT